MKILIALSLVCVALAAPAITATKAFVQSATNAVYVAATNASVSASRAYTDQAVQQSGSVTPAIVTNITASATNDLMRKISAALDQVDVSRITDGTNTIRADLSVSIGRVVATNLWLPAHSQIPENPTEGSMYCANVRWVANRWVCSMAVYDGSAWGAPTGSWYMSGSGGDNPDATVLTFPFAGGETYLTATNVIVAATNSLALASDCSALAATAASQSNTLAAVVSIVTGEDARLVVTNPASGSGLPNLSLQMKVTDPETGASAWTVPWSETSLFDAFAGTNFVWSGWGGFYSWSTNLAALVSMKSEREYAYYDGVTGGPAPDGFFWISQPKVAIASGSTFNRYVTSGGEVWVLESNGTVSEFANAGTNGFFRICDIDGNSQFEIVKGASSLVYAAANSLTSTNVSGVLHHYVEYYITNAVSAPIAYASTNLTLSAFVPSSDSSCPANFSWSEASTSGGVSRYVLEFWPKSDYPRLFVTARYGSGSSSKIVHHAPVQLQSIVIGGVTYTLGTATISGHTVLTLTPQ